MSPRGGLTPGVDRRGAIIARRTANRARSACPHTWTGALRSGAPPDGEQTAGLWQMTMRFLCQLRPQRVARARPWSARPM